MTSKSFRFSFFLNWLFTGKLSVNVITRDNEIWTSIDLKKKRKICQSGVNMTWMNLLQDTHLMSDPGRGIIPLLWPFSNSLILPCPTTTGTCIPQNGADFTVNQTTFLFFCYNPQAHRGLVFDIYSVWLLLCVHRLRSH